VVVCNVGISYSTPFQTLYVGPTVNIQSWDYLVFGFLQLPGVPKRTHWEDVYVSVLRWKPGEVPAQVDGSSSCLTSSPDNGNRFFKHCILFAAL